MKTFSFGININMKKLKINGAKLRSTISSMSLLIKSAAEDKGKIGVKTLHRMLNGEEINKDVVLKLFQNLGLDYIEYLSHNNSSEEISKDNESKIELTANPNYTIILNKFELPHSYYLPLKIIWVFDFTNPSEEILELLESFNSTLTEYCGTEKSKVDTLSFENSFLRLKSTNIIDSYVSKLASYQIQIFSSLYKVWEYSDEEWQYEDFRVAYLNSEYQLALYFTRDNLKRFIASVNIGTPPPLKVPDGYNNIIVDGNSSYYNNEGEIDIPF